MLIMILYMFRALYAHHQEVELYWCSIWYRPLSQWPFGAQVERELLCSECASSWSLSEMIRTIFCVCWNKLQQDLLYPRLCVSSLCPLFC